MKKCKMKKCKISAIFLLLCLFLFLAPPAVQAKTPKKTADAASKVVKNYFRAQKKTNISAMNKCFVRQQITPIRKTGYFAKYLRKQNRKLSYKIVSVKGKGSRVSVKVKCTYKSAYRLFAAAIRDASAYFGSDPDALADSEQVYDYVSEYIRKKEKRYPARSRTKTVTLNLVKRKKGWKIKKCTDDMKNILWLDYFRLLDDLS